MVNRPALLFRLIFAQTQNVTNPSPQVRAALQKGSYPWYDPKTDAVRPVWPPSEAAENWLSRWLRSWRFDRLERIGEVVAWGLTFLALLILLGLLVRLWRIYRPQGELLLRRRRRSGDAPARIEPVGELPEGLRPEDGASDPWSEAIACRARGDYARAAVHLFADQLLTLDRLGKIRLAPSRTGRQLVRSVADDAVRRRVGPALRLFESVYYGHLVPDAATFEPVWREAEAFHHEFALATREAS